MKYRTEKIVDVQEWDKLVTKTYGRPYSLQQQNDCHDRGVTFITVPDKEAEDFENDTIPEIVNGPEMGVSFEAWKSRDPKQPLKSEEKGCRDESWAIDLWWGRNFYPCLQVVANDLHARGLLEAGEYGINIDW